MSIIELAKECPDLTISIKADDLEKVLKKIVADVIESYESKKQPETYLSRRQTAERLGVNLSTLYHWNRKNYLCPVSVGKKKFYLTSDVERILTTK